MYDLLICWYDADVNPLSAIFVPVDKMPTQDVIVRLSSKLPFSFATVVVTLTCPNETEPIATDVYWSTEYGSQN